MKNLVTVRVLQPIVFQAAIHTPGDILEMAANRAKAFGACVRIIPPAAPQSAPEPEAQPDPAV